MTTQQWPDPDFTTPQQAPGPILSERELLEQCSLILADAGWRCSPPITGMRNLQEKLAAALAAVPGKEPVARLMRWEAPEHMAVPHGGVCARTFAEFPKGAGEDGYWKEGEPLYTRAAPVGEVAAATDVKAIHSAVLALKCNPANTMPEKVAFLAGVHRAAAVVSQFAALPPQVPAQEKAP